MNEQWLLIYTIFLLQYLGIMSISMLKNKVVKPKWSMEHSSSILASTGTMPVSIVDAFNTESVA